MTTEELQEIVEDIESVKFLLDERDLDSQALQVELAGLPPTKNLVPHELVLSEVEGMRDLTKNLKLLSSLCFYPTPKSLVPCPALKSLLQGSAPSAFLFCLLKIGQEVWPVDFGVSLRDAHI